MSGFYEITEPGDATLNGIEGWMKHQFEHLGWMVLAKNGGMDEKVVAYLKANDRLKLTIEKRIESLGQNDNEIKKDLNIVLKKLVQLIDVTNKIFNKDTLKSNICAKCKIDLGMTGGKKKTSRKTSKKISKNTSKRKTSNKKTSKRKTSKSRK